MPSGSKSNHIAEKKKAELKINNKRRNLKPVQSDTKNKKSRNISTNLKTSLKSSGPVTRAMTTNGTVDKKMENQIVENVSNVTVNLTPGCSSIQTTIGPKLQKEMNMLKLDSDVLARILASNFHNARVKLRGTRKCQTNPLRIIVEIVDHLSEQLFMKYPEAVDAEIQINRLRNSMVRFARRDDGEILHEEPEKDPGMDELEEATHAKKRKITEEEQSSTEVATARKVNHGIQTDTNSPAKKARIHEVENIGPGNLVTLKCTCSAPKEDAFQIFENEDLVSNKMTASDDKIFFFRIHLLYSNDCVQAPNMPANTKDQSVQVVSNVHIEEEEEEEEDISGAYSPHAALWTKEETVKFYNALEACGANPFMIGHMVPEKSYRDIKVKFEYEKRHNLNIVLKALCMSTTWQASRLVDDYYITFMEPSDRKLAITPKNEEIFLDRGGLTLRFLHTGWENLDKGIPVLRVKMEADNVAMGTFIVCPRRCIRIKRLR